MRYLSICSGIEAATCAWHSLGWEAAGFAEIDGFASACLAARWPGVPNFGDFTAIEKSDVGPIDVLVGGTPCQSFSIAGLREGLRNKRGNLALEYFRLASRTKPRWLLWENVPGVLSSNGGRDFGAILGAMVECGYGFAYRVLDAQYFGVPQRRRRVFLVGYLGNWRPAAAVLFERQSLRWNSPPRRDAKEDLAGTFGARAQSGGGLGTDFDLAGGLQASRGGADENDARDGRLVAHTVATLDASYGRLQGCSGQDAKHGHSHLVPIAFHARQDPDSGAVTHPVDTYSQSLAVAVSLRGREGGATAELGGDVMPALSTGGGGDKAHTLVNTTVRRLTPRECERLQGFKDDYTRIPIRRYAGRPTSKHFARYPDHYDRQPDGSYIRHAADGPRYRALGNSMAVPCMSWLGERIDLVESILTKSRRKKATAA